MYCHHDGIRDEREFQYGALIFPLNKEEALGPLTTLMRQMKKKPKQKYRKQPLISDYPGCSIG